MSMADIARGRNSYYILQLIENDSAKSSKGKAKGPATVHIFRRWGRIGDSSGQIGGSKLEELEKVEAIEQFEALFLDKTGNDWREWALHKRATKYPGKFLPVDTDFGKEAEAAAAAVAPEGDPGAGEGAAGPVVDPRVESLLSTLFDIETYKHTMVQLSINLDELPLGKLSRAHITEGFAVLSGIADLLSQPQDAKRDASLRDQSSRFATVIPQVAPQAILSQEQLAEKAAMLEALRDMELAAKLVGAPGSAAARSTLYSKYQSVGCEIRPLEQGGAEFALLEKYLGTNHGPTHTDWTLSLVDAFSLDRANEAGRFIPYEQVPNRTLLWHGSRMSNMVGILSQGLRVAPPEAPVTGYMFGKGVYFADMASKSAQYCYCNAAANTGILLLCEVALGNSQELRKATALASAGRGKHSVKGLGKYVPDPKEHTELPGGVRVPIGALPASTPAAPQPGKPVVDYSVVGKGTELAYNEFIVYDEAQVRLKYLLKVQFNYKPGKG